MLPQNLPRPATKALKQAPEWTILNCRNRGFACGDGADKITQRIKAGQMEGAGGSGNGAPPSALDQLCDHVLTGAITAGKAATQLLGD